MVIQKTRKATSPLDKSGKSLYDYVVSTVILIRRMEKGAEKEEYILIHCQRGLLIGWKAV